jgi:hypothetical protein
VKDVQNYANVDVGKNAKQTVLVKSHLYPAQLGVVVLICRTKIIILTTS